MKKILQFLCISLFSSLSLADGLSGVSNVPVYDGTGLLISPLAVVSGTDTFDGGYVIIETNLDVTNDRLQIRSGFSLPAGVTTSYDTTNGVFEIIGTGISPANLQSIIRHIEYINLQGGSASQSDRRINVVIGDKIAFSGNGHFYEYVQFDSSIASAGSGRSWTTAQTAAAGTTYFGLNGYLATITSALENSFVIGKVSGNAWLGANDAETEGTFKWVVGPEAGNNLTSGYTNWNSNEPNNSGGEDYVHIMDWTDPPGRWNDLPINGGGEGNYKATGYIVEWSGTPSVNLTGVATLQVNGPTVVLSAPSYSTINSDVTGPILYTITYDNVTDSQVTLAQSQISLTTTGSASATASLSGSGLIRTVTLTNVSGEGDITLNLASGTASNTAGSIAAQTAQTFRRECFQVTAVNVDDFGVERETAAATDACFVYH